MLTSVIIQPRCYALFCRQNWSPARVSARCRPVWFGGGAGAGRGHGYWLGEEAAGTLRKPKDLRRLCQLQHVRLAQNALGEAPANRRQEMRDSKELLTRRQFIRRTALQVGLAAVAMRGGSVVSGVANRFP